MFEKTRWETYGLIGIAFLWAKWRDVFIEKLKIPLKTLSELIVFYNKNKSNYYLRNAHSLPSTTYTKLHLILIIAPRDVILVIHMKKVRFSSLHICSGGETEKGAESGPKPVVNTHILLYIVSTQGWWRSIQVSWFCLLSDYFKRFILHQKLLFELSIIF